MRKLLSLLLVISLIFSISSVCYAGDEDLSYRDHPLYKHYFEFEEDDEWYVDEEDEEPKEKEEDKKETQKDKEETKKDKEEPKKDNEETKKDSENTEKDKDKHTDDKDVNDKKDNNTEDTEDVDIPEQKDTSEGIGWETGKEYTSEDFEETNIEVYIKGYTNSDGNLVNEYQKVDFKDVKPQIVDNRTMVPIRAVAEQIGYEVKWTSGTKRIDLIGKSTSIQEELPYQCEVMYNMLLNNCYDARGNRLPNLGNTYFYFNNKKASTKEFEQFYELLSGDSSINYGIYLVVGNKKGVTYIGRTGVNALDEVRAEYTMDVSPMIYQDRTLLPLRAVGEMLGFEVEWDDKTRTVYIDGKQ